MRMESKKYWIETLDRSTFTKLPQSNSVNSTSDTYLEQNKILGEDIKTSLIALSDLAKVPLRNVLLGIHLKVLSSLSGHDDITSELFIDRVFLQNPAIVPFRIKHESESWLELFKRINSIYIEMQNYCDYPLEMIQRDSNVNSLFDILFRYHTTSNQNFESELYPLTVNIINENKGYLELLAQWETRKYSEEQIGMFLSIYEEACIQAIKNPHELHTTKSILPRCIYESVLNVPNNKTEDISQIKNLHGFFEQQAELYPEKVAIYCGKRSMSYRKLNSKANQIANVLIYKGIKPENRIGVYMNRSIEMVISILGILKAGAAYVPLDPTYPHDRLLYMIADSEISLIISDDNTEANLGVEMLSIEQLVIEQTCPINPQVVIAPEQLAYVIYTSGSTGKPKGVAIQHKNAVSFINWAKNEFEIYTDGILASTSICFDLSIFEIFVPLSSGGSTILIDNILYIEDLPQKNKILLINTVPSAMEKLLDMNLLPESVKVINLAGEPLKANLVKAIYQNEHIKKVNNLYGPSEDTTYSTWGNIKKCIGDVPSIGRPISNCQVYVLDRYMQPVPIGTPGELYLGGQGQARGYLNKGEITAEKFVPNPFAKSPGQRLYRTGDEVRFKLDGTLEFLGRLDQQVKIRGYRIELGEVEFAIEQIKGVEKVVVIAKEDEQNHNYLIAYISGSIAREVILDKVKLRLPSYMIPTNIICLDEFPLTPNGKIDRVKLPNSVWVQEGNDTVLSGMQKEIREIWKRVLGIESVGIYDGFLDVGGDSLLATQIFIEIRKAFKIDLKLTEILKVSTIEEQAKLIAEKQSKDELIKPAAIQVRKREARKIKL